MKGILTLACAVLATAAIAGPRIATEAWVSNYVGRVTTSQKFENGANVYTCGSFKMTMEDSSESALVVVAQTEESIAAGITNGMLFAASPSTHSYVNGEISIGATSTNLTLNVGQYEYHSFMLRGSCWLVRDLEDEGDDERRRVAFCKLASTKIQPKRARELLGE